MTICYYHPDGHDVMTIRMVISHDPPDGQELEFLEGLDGQKNRICSDHPDGQNVMTIRMVRSHDHPNDQALEFLEGPDGHLGIRMFLTLRRVKILISDHLDNYDHPGFNSGLDNML